MVGNSTSLEVLKQTIDRVASLLAVRRAELNGKSDIDLDPASSWAMYDALSRLISELSGGGTHSAHTAPTPSHWSEIEAGSEREPDFDYYAKLQAWGVREAIALATGLDPNFVSSDERGHVFDWAQSAVKAGQLSDPVSPPDFLDWMQRWDHTVDQRLVEAIRRYEGRYRSEKSGAGAPPSSTKAERQSDATNKMKSTQQLLVFFAYRAGYIQALGGPVPELGEETQIEKDMEKLRIRMSRSTIKIHFRDAVRSVWSEFFPK